MVENRHIIRQIICAILFFEKQGLHFVVIMKITAHYKNPGGHDLILADLVAEVIQSNFYSVLADEVPATTLSNYLFAFVLWTVKATFVKNT